MRAYYLPNTASAQIQCCGSWIHIGPYLIGIAPDWFFTNRIRKGLDRPFRVGLAIKPADISCGMQVLFGLEIGQFFVKYTTRGESCPGHYRWDEVGWTMRGFW